ncbi:MAG: ECF-type sigma factor [Verrucomicrobiales bacterium]|nr:ECF-type sigma factor [Verrucomicrobiales bacterium]
MENTLGNNALADLCQLYWYPVYAYIRRRGKTAHDTEDLTQEFFFHFLERKDFGSVDQAKGRLRSFLCTAVSHFLSQSRRSEQAQKRGGGQTVISIDAELAEHRYGNEPVDSVTPEKLFERRWALTILDNALDELRAEYIRLEKGNVFDALSGFLTGRGGAESYAEVARSLEMQEAAVKMAAHRLRKRFRDLLCRHITATVESPEEVDEEIQWMMAAFRD